METDVVAIFASARKCAVHFGCHLRNAARAEEPCLSMTCKASAGCMTSARCRMARSPPVARTSPITQITQIIPATPAQIIPATATATVTVSLSTLTGAGC
jgi:hypothetical protein